MTALLVIGNLALGTRVAEAAPPGAPVLTGYPQGTVGADNAAFTFHSPGGADFYQCRTFVTGSPAPAFATCSGSSRGYHTVDNLAEGEHTFEARGVDGGDVGPSTSWTWTVTSDPIVQWIDEPTGSSTKRRPWPPRCRQPTRNAASSSPAGRRITV